MIDEGLLQKLHDEGCIDKNHVLWWQLGFEGRRVFSEDEFSEGLERVSYEVSFDLGKGDVDPHEKSFNVWVKDEVPILLREGELLGEKATYFISVKPMSHPDSSGDGWRSLRIKREFGTSIGVYHSPHVRGLVIDRTPDFLFWHPFLHGEPQHYLSSSLQLENLDMPIMICPIHPTKFYSNLIKGEWNKGKRPQKRAIQFDINRKGFELVPYHEFDYQQKHLAIYPVPLFDGKLDLPGVILGNGNKPSLLGVGYPEFSTNSLHYWELSPGQQRKAKRSLIERMGNVSRK